MAMWLLATNMVKRENLNSKQVKGKILVQFNRFKWSKCLCGLYIHAWKYVKVTNSNLVFDLVQVFHHLQTECQKEKHYT